MRPRKVILLVDENEQTRSTRRFLLDNKGFRVIAVASAAEAVGIVSRREAEAPELLVTQLMLRGMDGLQLIEWARKARPEMPALLLCEKSTLHAYVEARRKTVAFPINVVDLSKDSAAVLVQAVRTLLIRKRGPRRLLPRQLDDQTAKVEAA